jgi:carbamoyltransferase
LIEGKVIGWFEGRLEFGPRALGSRSIIGDARNTQMQTKMNLKIKFRESFRPFAPTVLREEVSGWFELERESPYMLLVAPVKEDKRFPQEENSAKGFDKLKIIRSQIPAVTHVDYTARIQTIERKAHPLYYDLIDCFYKKTGCPVIINTSFNVRGEPLVCSPEDAFRCFMRTEMDFLMIGSFLLDKKEQRPLEKDIKWQEVFELD